MSDLTDPEYMQGSFGSFWSRVFPDTDFLNGIALGASNEINLLTKIYRDCLRSISIDTVEEFRDTPLWSVKFSESDLSNDPDKLKFGQGQVYGPQVEGGTFEVGREFEFGGNIRLESRFYIPVDKDIVSVGSVISERLTNPSVVLLNGIHFSVVDNYILFKDNPFLNGDIPYEMVSKDGVPEKQITLWIHGVRRKSEIPENNFGYAAAGANKNSDRYFGIIKASQKAIASGPTKSNIDHLMASLMGLPSILSETETVTEITSYLGNTVVVTDKQAYKLPEWASVRPNVIKGATLAYGSLLCDGTEILDPREDRGWWRELPSLTISPSAFNLDVGAPLGFRNEFYKIELSDPLDSPVPDEEQRRASFFISGDSIEVQKFWEKVNDNASLYLKPLGNIFYENQGAVNGDGFADFSQDVYINPLQFICENALFQTSVIIKVKSSSLDSVADLFSASNLIKNLLPPTLSLIILIDIDIDEEWEFQRTDGNGVEPLSLGLIGTPELFDVEVESYPTDEKDLWSDTDSDGEFLTKCPEGIGMDTSPDMGDEVISFGSAEENLESYGAETTSCVESLDYSFQPICKQ